MLKLQTILYELAMAIGNSFEEDANAKELIQVFIKRLSCKGALVIKGNHNIIFSFPKSLTFPVLKTSFTSNSPIVVLKFFSINFCSS